MKFSDHRATVTNRASRRALGVHRRHGHGKRWRSLQAALKSLRPYPWQIVDAEVVEDAA
nr:hypothetical protein [Mycobacterium eburneum]